jgi:hypothetical protein
VVDIQWYAYDTASDRRNYQYLPFGKLAMDEYGRLLPCPDKFPSAAGGAGFAPLAKAIHEMGLKFGIHIMRGIPRLAAHQHFPVSGCDATADQIANPSSICGWNPDMYGVKTGPAGQAYYDSLLALYAAWGVDFIKCDDICNTNLYPANPYSARQEIEMLSSAVERCGREMVLSLSPGPALIEQAWHYRTHANMWRITDDFWDNWDLLKNMFARCELWQDHVAEGSYPDCDMLPLGRIGKVFGQERATNFTPAEQKTMMTLWCLFRSPLMLGAELTQLDDATLKLLTNREVLALLREGCHAVQVTRTADCAVWAVRGRTPDELYLALFNLSDATATVAAGWKHAAQLLHMDTAGKAYSQAWELWDGSVRALFGEDADGDTVSATLPAHDCALLRLE